MAWQSKEREKARGYKNEEARAFRSGYSDGYHGAKRDPGDWPCAYNAGYWEGFADAERKAYCNPQIARID